MAGDALAKGGRKMSELEQRLGSKEFKRIGAEGFQAPTDKGKWTAAEVKAEFRNPGQFKIDEGDNSIVDRFRQIQEEGGMFTGKAKDFLTNKYGFDFAKNNSNDGNSTDGTNTGGNPGDDSGGGTEPGDGGVTPESQDPVTGTANPGSGSGGGDASNTNKTEQSIGDSTITNSPGASITNNNTNQTFQQSFGGNSKSFNYNGGGKGKGKGMSGIYDTPASMATLAGYYDVDDSPSAGQAFASAYIGGNNLHQAAMKANYDANTDKDYAAQAASVNQFNPYSMQQRIDEGHLDNRDRATVEFAELFGDIKNMDWTWKPTTPYKPIENNLDETAEDYEDMLS